MRQVHRPVIYGIHLISDAAQGYHNTKLMVAAETVARELPEAHGHFISLYGERLAVFYVGIGTDGIARLQAGFVEDGFIQGETLAPIDYVVCGADDRRMNNQSSSTRPRGITSTMVTF